MWDYAYDAIIIPLLDSLQNILLVISDYFSFYLQIAKNHHTNHNEPVKLMTYEMQKTTTTGRIVCRQYIGVAKFICI